MKTIHQVLGSKNNFDAIRLLAAIGVILSHSYPVTQGSNEREFLYVLSGGQSTLGDLCVAIFFVISGFLITQSFLRSASLIDYFTNRVLRIVPGLFAVSLLICGVLGPIVTDASILDYWSDDLTPRYMGNALIYLMAQELPDVFATRAFPFYTNASIWTLPYEFTCYIFVAAICLALRQAWLLSLLMLGFATAAAFYTDISPPFLMPLASYFLAGCIAYAARKWIVLDLRIFFVSIAALCLSIVLHRGFIPVFCVAGAYATIYLAYAGYSKDWDIARYGDFSYGVYLYAWPVQQLISPYSASPLANFLASTPIIMVCAVCSWKFIEKPSLSMKRIVANFLGNKVGAIKYRFSPG
jgi:peptidoglycan/LPS O-acetylase OafA/YrhL